MSYRVLRLINYVYPDKATGYDDMLRWGVPENGHYSAPKVTISSSIIAAYSSEDKVVNDGNA